MTASGDPLPPAKVATQPIGVIDARGGLTHLEADASASMRKHNPASPFQLNNYLANSIQRMYRTWLHRDGYGISVLLVSFFTS